MKKENIAKCLEEIISKERIKINEPMNKHTSFKIGGNAEFFVKVDSLEELRKILNFTKENKIETTIVGNGTNLLVLDNGIQGIVIKLDLKKIEIEEKNQIEITVESGVQLGFLAQKFLKEEITRI